MGVGLVVLLRLIFNMLRTKNEGTALGAFLALTLKTYKLAICVALLLTEMQSLSYF